MTQGFADMDEGAQRNIIALAAVAAAASPFLTTTGRIVKTVGNTVTAVGKARQEWGVYADALTTTNASALKTYSSNEKLSKALEKNPAAKAAGGVEKYVEAVRNANSDTSKYNTAVRQAVERAAEGQQGQRRTRREPQEGSRREAKRHEPVERAGEPGTGRRPQRQRRPRPPPRRKPQAS